VNFAWDKDELKLDRHRYGGKTVDTSCPASGGLMMKPENLKAMFEFTRSRCINRFW
jgi:hypothetical protein